MKIHSGINEEPQFETMAARLAKSFVRDNYIGFKMATAKKSAPKAATTTKKTTAPAKAAKPVAKAAPKKAPVSKVVKAMASITRKHCQATERKNKPS